MAITRDQVLHVAQLARLEFGDDEIDAFTEQLSAILDYVAKLDELDLADTEPMAHVHDAVNAFRDDEVRPSLGQEAVLANAPEAEDGCFRVPKVIEA
ncbi:MULTISPECIES: Asp-tRNA(Asn)/Glu-tRNA(Gln) amidotransferase subunit GatC [Deferrisoma]|nr:MAG: Asp-tRNA(Asn)/Glu-tRNA(Gln) amidotransferase subunit GatC [Candidatus Dadabacteria bacterium]